MQLTTTPESTGHTLRRARELAGVRERTAARALGIRRARLRDWESGAEVPDADELARAIQLYSADLNEIWPDRAPLVSGDEPGVLVVGDERIDLRADPTLTADGVTTIDNRVVLTRYLAAVRRQRGLGTGEAVELRATDIASLASVLDLEDTALEAELAELLDLTPAGARWTARAMVVGGLMAIGATAVVGSSWLAPAGATTIETAAPAAVTATFAPEVAPTTQVSARASVQFAPDTVDPDAPVEAEIVPAAPAADGTASPFTTDPNAAPDVELAPAVFATAPATEWTEVPEVAEVADAPAALGTEAAELPPA